jgi:hypothetical protein
MMEQRAEPARAASQGWIRPDAWMQNLTRVYYRTLIQGRGKNHELRDTKFVIQFNRLSLRLRYFVFVFWL